MVNNQVNIQGNKVILRDLTEDDVKHIYYWIYEAEDREHMKWNGPYIPVEPKTYETFYNDYKDDLKIAGTKDPRSTLVIEADQKLIGTVGWYWVSKHTNWLENGIVIYDSTYWSGGYGTDAFSLWTDYIFENMDVVRVGITTWSGNERMIRLAEKVGMIEEGRIRKARIVDGKYYDSVKMGILRVEWKSRKSSR
ncbi:RimJ/RimL family protein N-acetyltransferase [Scopulibacillus daqui]|uniref:RimJ/RimL family protein N-acetyltransferase n=1 Tax=Scopulibacillus daqui TaxID=1469162 RepID=A0ABS2Q1P2_9BACL|nr:GNAT family protein [Scopulibacillus daqui]MBM7646216.1 RimJ/RimL family protein N-acetyltransferase [Scopulibacillus daqui]